MARLRSGTPWLPRPEADDDGLAADRLLALSYFLLFHRLGGAEGWPDAVEDAASGPGTQHDRLVAAVAVLDALGRRAPFEAHAASYVERRRAEAAAGHRTNDLGDPYRPGTALGRRSH